MSEIEPKGTVNPTPVIRPEDYGVKIPEIPNRKERRRRAKSAGIFKYPGGFKRVNDAANMQRTQAIHRAVDLANKKVIKPKK